MKLNRNERSRTFILFVFILFWVGGVVTALVKHQILEYDKNINRVKAHSSKVSEVHSKRGTIYDRNGEVLAMSVMSHTAYLSNLNKKESLKVLGYMKKTLGLTYKKLIRLRKRVKRGQRIILVERKIDDDRYKKLLTYNKSLKDGSSLFFVEEYKREYPQGHLASHVLGGVNSAEVGAYGVEFGAEKYVKGKDGKVQLLLDARRKVYELQYIKKPVKGRDVWLTIDSAIQFFVEKELMDTVKKYNAKGGSVVVMDSRNGELLAMASYPNYDPARLRYLKSSSEALRNRAVSFVYEPGSTFKIILAASALKNQICYPQQIFDCMNGKFKYKDRTIYDDHVYKALSFEDIFVHSSNVGSAQIGIRLGKKRYYKAIREFGFGSKTGVMLSGEERGLLRPTSTWSSVAIAYIAHGYGLSVTPLQMTRAFNVVASGGVLHNPRLVSRIGEHEENPNKPVKIINQGTQSRLVSIMKEVVNRGTGKKTFIPGMEVAGKTGTAKKVVNRKYRRVYVASFGGFFPASNPRVTIFAVIDEPKGKKYGGDVAAPLFKTIAEKLAIYLRIYPELDSRTDIRI